MSQSESRDHLQNTARKGILLYPNADVDAERHSNEKAWDHSVFGLHLYMIFVFYTGRIPPQKQPTTVPYLHLLKGI